MRFEEKTLYCHNKLCRHVGYVLGIQYDYYHLECPECGFRTYKSDIPVYLLDELLGGIKTLKADQPSK